MKKVFILLALTAVAVATGACNGGKNGKNAKADSLNVKTVYDIAYVDLDSLKAKYNRAIDLSAAFEAKMAKSQSDLEVRARRLQNEIADFQEKVSKGLMTRSQAAELQAQLERKSANFDVQSQQKQEELAEEQYVTVNQIMYAITQYLAKFNADHRYKMVLSTTGGVPVLHADPALNITNEVIDGLNAEYAEEQKNAPKEK